MGEVYRAHDTKLGRDVALKILPSGFTHDPDRLARFKREAQVLASLNHPHIAAIYGLEEANGSQFLVLELVEGDTLAQRIARGPIPLEEARTIARQIAEALEGAHEKGIVHRDLKPSNIAFSADDRVRVLDLGLAKALDRAPNAVDITQSPTLTSPVLMTGMGVILGTAAYMSPEQAKGRVADTRSDIWAFGCVIYEMLTGQRPFQGDDVAETVAAVITKEPDWQRVPAKVQRLLRRCLEKDPKKRLRHVSGVDFLLEDAPGPVGTAPSKSRLEVTSLMVAAVALLALAALAFIHFRETPPEMPILRTTILPPENTALDFTQDLGLPALSPDGRKIVFGARTPDGKAPLWIRALDSVTAQPLAGTDGATFPFWRPDSKFIAFFADGKLKKIDASGGPALPLAEAPLGRGGSWNQEGIIIFAPSNNTGPLLRVSEVGGTASPISSEKGRAPWYLPDGQHLLYQNLTTIRLGSLDGAPSKLIGEASSSNTVYAQGHLLFLREGMLMAQPFDANRLMATGDAVPIAEEVQSVLNSGTIGAFSVSSTGLLVFRGGAGIGSLVLTLFDRSGKPGTTVGDAGHFANLSFSPDRRSLAVANRDASSHLDIWIVDVSRGIPTRFPSDPGQSFVRCFGGWAAFLDRRTT
jgi:serine/threonine protein kinase